MRPRYSVVIPCYNEQQTIQQVLANVVALPIPKEVIVVDDGSADNTSAIAVEWQRKFECLRVLRNAVNLGKGASIRREDLQ